MSSLREIQLFGLKILKEVVKICDENGLTYYLGSGTLLGAVRHKGFIPWDNDIDIEMPIGDYRKFIKFASKKLPDWLFLQTYATDKGYNELWAKVRANGTTSMPIAWKEYSIHMGIGIDIFPIVGLYKGKRMRRLQDDCFSLCRTLLAKEYLEAIKSTEIQDNKKLKLIYALPWKTRILLCKVLELIALKPIKAGGHASDVFLSLSHDLPFGAYGEGSYALFEGEQFRIPNDFDAVLTEYYGDYMTPPPESERGFGHEMTHGKIIYECNVDYRELL